MANLIRFLKNLKNETVTIECKDKLIYNGIVSAVDHEMNVTLKKATLKIADNEEQPLDVTVIKGSSIRNIVLPDTMNLDYNLVEKTKTPLVPPGKVRRL